MGKDGKTSKTERESTQVPPQAFVLLDPRFVGQAINHIVKNLNDPEYQNQLTKLTQVSITNSLQTLQKLTQFSTRVSQLDREGLEGLVEGSIDDLTRAYLQFSSDLLVLLQKLSSRTLEILDNASPQNVSKKRSRSRRL